MVQVSGISDNAVPEAAFDEEFVEADGFRIRYRSAGEGDPLVVFHGAGGMNIYRSHRLLAQHNRVILFEVPGFGKSPANLRSQSVQELALTMANAIASLGITSFNLMGNSFGGTLALWLAMQLPEKVQALVLVGPAAIRPEGSQTFQTLSQEELMAKLYAHPELHDSHPTDDPAVREKQRELVGRLRVSASDQELEVLMSDLNVPVLVLFGTKDQMTPPEMGRVYCERLPNCNFILVYDAAHEADADRPEAFSALAGDFLQRHEGFLVNSRSEQIHP